jgi:hypothetical protein
MLTRDSRSLDVKANRGARGKNKNRRPPPAPPNKLPSARPGAP